MHSAAAAWHPDRPVATLAGMSKPSPETIAIIAVGATLLIAVCSVGIGLGMLWSNGQARTDAVIAEGQARTDAAVAELRRDVSELRGDVQEVRERLAPLEGAILAQREPGAEG